MKKTLYQLALFVFISTQLSCTSESEAENYKDAYLVSISDSLFIKLRGKRVPLHIKGTYEDSILIPVSKAQGRIEGKDISVKKGYYGYQGFILIKDNEVTINLLLDNYDDKRLDPFSWNGKYTLLRSPGK